jgi:hypothetical protein
MFYVLIVELALEFFQQACGEPRPFQMQANPRFCCSQAARARNAELCGPGASTDIQYRDSASRPISLARGPRRLRMKPDMDHAAPRWSPKRHHLRSTLSSDDLWLR